MTSQPRRVPVAAIAGGLFCIALILLALQARAGNDPAIGAGSQAAAQPVRRIIVKRVVVRRIVELPPKPPKHVAAAAVSSAYQAPAYQPSSAPVRAAAPAPAAAPPPPAAAPPPAPVVSRGS